MNKEYIGYSKYSNVKSKSIGHFSLDNALGRMYRGPAHTHVKACMNTQKEDSLPHNSGSFQLCGTALID